MKILIIGATGTIGRGVVHELKNRHELILAGSKNGDITVDINDIQSIIKMYEALPPLDAIDYRRVRTFCSINCYDQ